MLDNDETEDSTVIRVSPDVPMFIPQSQQEQPRGQAQGPPEEPLQNSELEEDDFASEEDVCCCCCRYTRVYFYAKVCWTVTGLLVLATIIWIRLHDNPFATTALGIWLFCYGTFVGICFLSNLVFSWVLMFSSWIDPDAGTPFSLVIASVSAPTSMIATYSTSYAVYIVHVHDHLSAYNDLRLWKGPLQLGGVLRFVLLGLLIWNVLGLLKELLIIVVHVNSTATRNVQLEDVVLKQRSFSRLNRSNFIRAFEVFSKRSRSSTLMRQARSSSEFHNKKIDDGPSIYNQSMLDTIFWCTPKNAGRKLLGLFQCSRKNRNRTHGTKSSKNAYPSNRSPPGGHRFDGHQTECSTDAGGSMPNGQGSSTPSSWQCWLYRKYVVLQPLHIHLNGIGRVNLTNKKDVSKYGSLLFYQLLRSDGRIQPHKSGSFSSANSTSKRPRFPLIPDRDFLDDGVLLQCLVPIQAERFLQSLDPTGSRRVTKRRFVDALMELYIARKQLVATLKVDEDITDIVKNLFLGTQIVLEAFFVLWFVGVNLRTTLMATITFFAGIAFAFGHH